MELKRIRKIKGYTQIEISNLLQIPLRTIKRYESDPNCKNTYKYNKICEELWKLPVKTESFSNNRQNIAVVGAGYVGLSLAALLSIKNDVVVVDVNKNRVDDINNRHCYLRDDLLTKMFTDKTFKLKAMEVNDCDFSKMQIAIIATNTDFDANTGQFDMNNVVSSINNIRRVNSNCLIVIKSTVPMGFTKSLNDSNIIFSPEFLKEGTAVRDNLYPSRIILGADTITKKVKDFAKCLMDISLSNKDVIYMSSHEAEAVKLFSNAYLAMRVAYFNELDTYAETNDLNPKNIIQGVSSDPRIGDYYNNPSFGYGGYCLPKDTAQLENSFLNISNNNIIKAIVESNQTRKKHIINQIVKCLKNKEQVIGFYKVSMKKDSDNYRSSSTLDIATELIKEGYKVIIYDKNYESDYSVSFDELINRSDIIIANRMSKELALVANKVYTRDQFGNN